MGWMDLWILCCSCGYHVTNQMASTSGTVMTELIEDEGEPRYKITDIIGKSKIKQLNLTTYIIYTGIYYQAKKMDSEQRIYEALE